MSALLRRLSTRSGSKPFDDARQERLRKFFCYYDVDKNGALERQELLCALLEVGFEDVATDEVRMGALMAEFGDDDSAGFELTAGGGTAELEKGITFESFLKLVYKVSRVVEKSVSSRSIDRSILSLSFERETRSAVPGDGTTSSSRRFTTHAVVPRSLVDGRAENKNTTTNANNSWRTIRRPPRRAATTTTTSASASRCVASRSRSSATTRSRPSPRAATTTTTRAAAVTAATMMATTSTFRTTRRRRRHSRCAPTRCRMSCTTAGCASAARRSRTGSGATLCSTPTLTRSLRQVV